MVEEVTVGVGLVAVAASLALGLSALASGIAEKAIGTAARVRVGQRLIGIRVNEDRIDLAKEALRRAKMKLPCLVTTVTKKLK